MIDKSTPTKKDSSPHPLEKSTNNISPNLTIVKPENQNETTTQNNLLNNTESYTIKNNQNFTFKIIKRRAPWNKKEDEAIIELVKKYGTSNWTIIANEMANMYKSKHRNGKQCRERWHNHLDPIVNKENWTDEEENILFTKHLEYGNKWSDISKFLPGRTDNSIKNHFYSKLRKFIRKILKQINKENLLKNNGIDYYKYNSDKVYKLLKKYKITYKNVTKDTILDLIISTEKNQKGKIFSLSENKLTNNNNNTNNNSNGNDSSNNETNLEKKLNTDENKLNTGNRSKSSSGKKYKLKTKIKNNDENNGNNDLLKKDKKLFKSKLVTQIKSTKKEVKINNNIDKINLINQNNNNDILNNNNNKKKKKIKNNINNENEVNNNNESSKKKLTINPDYVNETYKYKSKSKQKIKEKLKKNSSEKQLLKKKRHRKKRRKISISLSTPENKKAKIDRIMPKRKFIFGLGQKLSIANNRSSKRKNKMEISPEDFDPLISNVEIVREGLEIHSKTIILISKSLLTENLFPESIPFRPNLNISIPNSPKNQQFPSYMNKSYQNEDNNCIPKFERNITIYPPTPMSGYFEPQLSPVALNNIKMYPPPSTKNIYNVDLGYENRFLRKNYPAPVTPVPFSNILFPNTPTREITLENKIIVQNNNNISNSVTNNIKKPEALNLEYIENYNNENISTNLFVGNENVNLNSTTNKMAQTPANIFNLSPTSPFIPNGYFGDNQIGKFG